MFNTIVLLLCIIICYNLIVINEQQRQNESERFKMINAVYFVNISNLQNVTLNYAKITFCDDEMLMICYDYDSTIDSEVKREAEWFDNLTYEF